MDVRLSPECEHCPVALNCASNEAVLTVWRESLGRQEGYHNKAEDAGRRAEIAGAFAILSGEITTEQHESVHAELRNSELFIDSDPASYARIRKQIENDYEQAAETQVFLDKTIGALSLAQDVCPGPKIGFWARIAEIKTRIRVMRASMKGNRTLKELHLADLDRQKEIHLIESSLKPRYCGNKATRRANKELSKHELK